MELYDRNFLLTEANGLRFYMEDSTDRIELKFFGLNDDYANPLLEEYDKKSHLKFTAEIMDQPKFIKRNEVQQITNPTFFERAGVPTSDGLLSNEIFGITMDERSGIYAYIDLHGTYIDPSIYKAMIKVNPDIKKVVHGIGNWKITDDGDLVEDEKGDSGIDFLKKNRDNIKFKRNDSMSRNLKIDYIERHIKSPRCFITKYIVIPAYYRDVNTSSSNVGVGFINKMYSNLISFANQSSEESYYGLSKTHATSGRIQETILAIYDYFSGNTNSMIQDKDVGVGLQGKFGIIRRSVTSKTADYSCRLVISAPNVKYDKRQDQMVDLDHAAVPLSSAITIFYPYMLFLVRRFFEKEFANGSLYPCVNKDTKEVKYYHVKDPLVEFSDERITAEMKRFIHGNSNRIIPIEVPVEEDDGRTYYLYFKGVMGDPENLDYNPEAIYQRRLTWVDVFYRAAVEACSDKVGLVTRYPMDSRYNQFPVGLVVSSTIETENMVVDGKFYKYYPKIREEDIGSDTSSTFIDTFVMSNLYLGAIGGDYDGDTVTLKGVYTTEANEELKAYTNTKANYVDLGGNIIRSPSKEAIISMYSLTMLTDNIMEGTLTDPQF
jgi:hypothetical protein